MRSRENKAHSGGAIRFSLRHSDAAYVRVHQVTDQTTGYSQDVPLSFRSIYRCLRHKPQQRTRLHTRPGASLHNTRLCEQIYRW